MTKTEKAIQFMLEIANDDSHGYDQANRWGKDYDCSSLVISAWKSAGVPLGCTYTGNMFADMLANGFADVTAEVNLGSGAYTKAGDVLLNHANHTAMCVGGFMIAQAGSNEFGGVTGGQPGDQTGREIRVMPYYNYPWDCVLRFVGDDTEAPEEQEAESYTVKPGDTLWWIGVECGISVSDLMRINGLTSDLIYPGQILKLKEDSHELEGMVRSNPVNDGADLSDGGYEQRPEEVTVKPGDTLWSLAEKYLGDGTRYAELAEFNGISSAEVNLIYVGQKINIPGGQANE